MRLCPTTLGAAPKGPSSQQPLQDVPQCLTGAVGDGQLETSCQWYTPGAKLVSVPFNILLMTWTMVQSEPCSSTQGNASGEEQPHTPEQPLLAQVGELAPITQLRTMPLKRNLMWPCSNLSITSSFQRVWVLQVSHFLPT